MMELLLHVGVKELSSLRYGLRPKTRLPYMEFTEYLDREEAVCEGGR